MSKQGSETRDCPWCAEPIRAAAVICRFCNRDVTPAGFEQAGLQRSQGQGLSEQIPGGAVPPGEQDDPILSRLSRFVPPALLQGLVQGAAAIGEGERRSISILFSDLAGFTTLTHEIGAEAMSELLRDIHAEVGQIVERYGGMVDKFIGDAVMALFGAPRAHGDDPERAIRAALEINDAVQAIGRRMDLDLRMHSGIAHGEVVFEVLGSVGRPNFNTVGEAVNLASRLQGIAEAGQIVVDHRIYSQARTTFKWESLGSVDLKGIKPKTRAHRVTAIRKQFAKVVLGERIELVDFVGRKKELSRLNELAHKACEGEAQIAEIRGEAGVGKSRVAYEFYHRLSRDDFNWFTGRCLSFGANVPLLPMKKLLKSILGFIDEDISVSQEDLAQAVSNIFAPALRRARSKERKAQLKRNEAAALWASCVLLDLNDPKNPLLSESAKSRRSKVFRAVVEILGQVSRLKPTVLVFEDFHWADSDSLELLNHLIVHLANSPILFLILVRPDSRHEFPSQASIEQIRLLELSDTESRRLVTRLLNLERLPKNLKTAILTKAEGNPFFLEEIILSLRERGVLQLRAGKYHLTGPIDKLQIPDTVEGIVLARLDALHATMKRVLQCASVIGQEFQYQTLNHVIEARERLKGHLLTLADGDYILQQALIPQLAYIFKHVVLRDVAYGTLLQKRRKHFHARVAEALREVFPERVGEFTEILAYHYEKGESFDEALDFLDRAASKCQRLYANHAAIDHWERLLVILKRTKREDVEARRLALKTYVAMARMLRLTGQVEQARSTNEKSLALADDLGDAQASVQARRELAEVLRLSGRTDEGLERLGEARKIARSSGDKRALANCENSLGHLRRTKGEFTEAKKSFRAAYRLAGEVGDRKQRFQALNHLGLIAMYAGKADEANRDFTEALELAAELGIREEEVQIRLNIGINHLRLGNISSAKRELLAVVAQAEKIELERGAQLAKLALVDLLVKTGDFSRAAAESKALIRRNLDSPYRDILAMTLSNQARAHIVNRRFAQARKALDQAVSLATEDENYFVMIDAHAARTELHLARNDGIEALKVVSLGMELLGEHPETEYIPVVKTLAARSHLALGDVKKAKEFALIAVRDARKARLPREEGWANWALGLCNQKSGRHISAIRRFDSALRLARSVQDGALAALVNTSVKESARSEAP